MAEVLVDAIEDMHRHVLDVCGCDLLLCSLFDEDSAARSLWLDVDLGIPSSGSNVATSRLNCAPFFRYRLGSRFFFDW
jgi:hypothetical protein